MADTNADRAAEQQRLTAAVVAATAAFERFTAALTQATIVMEAMAQSVYDYQDDEVEHGRFWGMTTVPGPDDIPNPEESNQ